MNKYDKGLSTKFRNLANFLGFFIIIVFQYRIRRNAIFVHKSASYINLPKPSLHINDIMGIYYRGQQNIN